jgi:hypothetical protein
VEIQHLRVERLNSGIELPEQGQVFVWNLCQALHLHPLEEIYCSQHPLPLSSLTRYFYQTTSDENLPGQHGVHSMDYYHPPHLMHPIQNTEMPGLNA